MRAVGSAEAPGPVPGVVSGTGPRAIAANSVTRLAAGAPAGAPGQHRYATCREPGSLASRWARA